jgi:hypothetical protein
MEAGTDQNAASMFQQFEMLSYRNRLILLDLGGI